MQCKLRMQGTNYIQFYKASLEIRCFFFLNSLVHKKLSYLEH